MTSPVDIGRFPLYPMAGWIPPRPRPRSPVRTLGSTVPFLSMIRPRDFQSSHLTASMSVATASVVPTEPTGEASGSPPGPPTRLGGADGRPPPAGA